MFPPVSSRATRVVAGWAAIILVAGGRAPAAPGPALSGTLANIAAGSVVDLTRESSLDWVHWGLYSETSLDRKAGVAPQISDFKLLDASNGFAYVYQYADHANGYSWSDGTPTAGMTNTTTGVWAYGFPPIDSGFEVTAPADTATRTLKVYVGAFSARGRFEAFLSDGSARGYTNTALGNQENGPGGCYTVHYAAGSAGQQLIVRWRLATLMGQNANVTLQAAALTATNINNLPFVALTAPANNQSVLASEPILITAQANDADGTVARVEFFADGVKLGEDTSSPFSFDWIGAPTGIHVLTARATDNQGASSSSSPVEVFLTGTGGHLLASLATLPNLPIFLNLTSEGTRDWTHWGLATNSLFNRKAGVVPLLSDFTPIGTNRAERYADNYTAYSWSDGTPTPSAASSTTGIYLMGQTNGFELTVPADTIPRQLKLYVGLYGAQGNFQAWLSDFSAPAYTDTTLRNLGSTYGLYTLTFAAPAPGRFLTIRYRSLVLLDQDFGNVTLQAATLSEGSGGNFPPTVAITNPPADAILTAPASFTLVAIASDSDGAVSQVEFFHETTALGLDTTAPYGVPVGNLDAGLHVFSAVATDNLGAKATNAVYVRVRSPLSPVTLFRPRWVQGHFAFSFSNLDQARYAVHCTDSLAPTNWLLLTNLVGNGAVLDVTNRNPSPATRCYRVESQ